MPKDKWPQWRVIYWVGNIKALQQEPINAGSPAAAIIRGLDQLHPMAGRRLTREITQAVTAIEVTQV